MRLLPENSNRLTLMFLDPSGSIGSTAPFGSELPAVVTALEPPIPRRSDSETCIQKLQEWVQECEGKHKGYDRPQFTPMRLLDVNPALGELTA